MIAQGQGMQWVGEEGGQCQQRGPRVGTVERFRKGGGTVFTLCGMAKPQGLV